MASILFVLMIQKSTVVLGKIYLLLNSDRGSQSFAGRSVIAPPRHSRKGTWGVAMSDVEPTLEESEPSAYAARIQSRCRARVSSPNFKPIKHQLVIKSCTTDHSQQIILIWAHIESSTLHHSPARHQPSCPQPSIPKMTYTWLSNKYTCVLRKNASV
jgi:hypothetical protein